MYKSLMSSCRCGEPRTGAHMLKCLQKQKNTFLHENEEEGNDEVPMKMPETSNILFWLTIVAICLLELTCAEPGYYNRVNNTGPSYQSPIRPNMFGYFSNHSRWNYTGRNPYPRPVPVSYILLP
ncbi:hypothetical protein GQX74_002792 [Glossina fuscipes]|nr:hypothetical protein GQX74_002792 [Glossina fuscipes]